MASTSLSTACRISIDIDNGGNEFVIGRWLQQSSAAWLGEPHAAIWLIDTNSTATGRRLGGPFGLAPRAVSAMELSIHLFRLMPAASAARTRRLYQTARLPVQAPNRGIANCVGLARVGGNSNGSALRFLPEERLWRIASRAMPDTQRRAAVSAHLG
jgi:hypothetical protein